LGSAVAVTATERVLLSRASRTTTLKNSRSLIASIPLLIV